ncbi:MAG: TetR family transcriptional regulator [Streptosporangiaceae bacterium]|nr:TetR family transcriptional regulator [Streptosporangiaceae bacterium]
MSSLTRTRLYGIAILSPFTAGLELFSRDANVSMADVARAAGLGRVTVYAHFPSRADLVEALVQRAIAEAEQALDARLATLGDQPADQALADLIGSTWTVSSATAGCAGTHWPTSAPSGSTNTTTRYEAGSSS